ncbi:unnamed protein product [Arctogadus glacialis]
MQLKSLSTSCSAGSVSDVLPNSTPTEQPSCEGWQHSSAQRHALRCPGASSALPADSAARVAAAEGTPRRDAPQLLARSGAGRREGGQLPVCLPTRSSLTLHGVL